MYTDIAGWIAFAPTALVLLIALVLLCGLLENTERAGRLMDATIRRIERTR